MNVLAVARTARDIEETASQATRLPGVCMAQSVDVTRSDQVDALVRQAVGEFGGLDVLVNNAGAAPLCSIDKIDDQLLTDTLGVNIRAVVYTCRAAWPALQRSRGTIINISSVAAKDPFPGFSLYGATKAWVNTFTQALAEEGKPFGIRAFSVGPGAVETQMLRGAFPNFPAEQTLHPDDIAAAIEWLLDERAAHVTGQTIYVKK
jgi:NAD(P)-dependent dehydrogenase (short-subunit alcohol dehydrogenase family)